MKISVNIAVLSVTVARALELPAIRMQSPLVVLCVFFLLNLTPGYGQEPITLESGLQLIDLKMGEGEPAVDGDVVVMHFKGWLDSNGEAGPSFIDSREVGDPLSFVLGTERVMTGWNKGVRGMRAGGKRRLMIPSELAYGGKGAGELVPPDTDVIFEIEVLEIRVQLTGN